MNRYVFYPVVLCMLANTILFVPTLLIGQRNDGAFASIGFSIILGYGFARLFATSLAKFPGQGLPEIFEQLLPGWVGKSFLLYLAVMWFMAGGIVLVTYSRIIQRFVNPDFNLHLLILFLAVVSSIAASGDSRSVMYLCEVLLFLNVPLIGLILFKALSNKYMDWDAVWSLTDYVFAPPSWQALSASSYVFTGYVNWSILNRSFPIGRKPGFIWAIPILGTGVLLTTFLIPVGLHGTVAVDHYIYIWISTADSLRMEFGFVERVLFVFLLLYLSVCLLFITLTWHIGMELTKGLLPRTIENALNNRLPWDKWAIFGTVTAGFMLLSRYFNEKQFIELTSFWLEIRLPSELLLVSLLWWLGRKVSA
ncbi:GerAB/ArcD/ProY family transporter [Paenibacillus chartarius]|uniref:GerAB/ArcD/ProY family transporter n=1 Tax=Paenibacillus chartarius TaxID=747481 RepID=A0ABV6DMW8_9BACL